MVRSPDRVLVVELKYKTRGVRVKGFDLANQSAQDVGRYDFLKDVERAEWFIGSRSAADGCAILLTNDSAYWREPRNSATVDAAFRLHEGRSITGTLDWSTDAAEGTVRGREKAIRVAGTYQLSWHQYSDLGTGGYSEFRYLLIAVS